MATHGAHRQQRRDTHTHKATHVELTRIVVDCLTVDTVSDSDLDNWLIIKNVELCQCKTVKYKHHSSDTQHVALSCHSDRQRELVELLVNTDSSSNYQTQHDANIP